MCALCVLVVYCVYLSCILVFRVCDYHFISVHCVIERLYRWMSIIISDCVSVPVCYHVCLSVCIWLGTNVCERDVSVQCVSRWLKVIVCNCIHMCTNVCMCMMYVCVHMCVSVMYPCVHVSWCVCPLCRCAIFAGTCTCMHMCIVNTCVCLLYV